MNYYCKSPFKKKFLCALLVASILNIRLTFFVVRNTFMTSSNQMSSNEFMGNYTLLSYKSYIFRQKVLTIYLLVLVEAPGTTFSSGAKKRRNKDHSTWYYKILKMLFKHIKNYVFDELYLKYVFVHKFQILIFKFFFYYYK